MLLYYEVLLGLSLLFTVIYAFLWHKHFDVNITMIFVLVPISTSAFLAVAQSETLETAILATKFSYIAGSFTILFILLAVIGLCHIQIPKILRGIFVALTMAIYLPVLTIGKGTLFYKKAELVSRYGVSMLSEKEYGIMHSVFYAWVFLLFFLCVSILIYSLIKKNHVSNKIIFLLMAPVVLAMLFFFGGRLITKDIELLPAAYVFSQFFYLLIVYRLSLYDINDSGLVSLLEKGETGFASFDFKLRFLGCNEMAEEALPMLRELHVDRSITTVETLQENVCKWIDAFRNSRDDEDTHFHYKSQDGEKTYHVDVNYLYDGRRRRGYQLFISDYTSDAKLLELQENYNAELKSEVEKKTKRIRMLNDHLILSMANMVESRDPFTGGHIKRTSEGVRLLVEQMKKDPQMQLTDFFCRLVIKAAPMHDLGKIAVPDAVLLKPGRYEPEEYEIMKSHSAEGARVVDMILKDTDNEVFRKVAVNVAHYHHERWDGKGYPEKLSGEQIPLEARIMAIADVYDALVSKRVYKESMSFEKADSIIMEGMGTQFDPGLEKYYVAARPFLEAYYREQAEKSSGASNPINE